MIGKKKGIDLATFVGGIVRALTKAQQALPKSRREQIEKHFEKNEDGHYVPKMMTFQLNESQTISVPNYSFSRVNNIGIDSAVVKCCARIVEIEDEEIECELADHNSIATYFVRPCTPLNKSFEIDIKFSKRTDIEAQNQLYQVLDAMVEVQDS